MRDSEIFITGARGQLGTALRARYPSAKYADKDSLDITDAEAVSNFDWSNVKVILNTAAYTDVDGAETPEGRAAAWKVNAAAVAHLSRVALRRGMTFVHISTDYVFDGIDTPHTESRHFSPISVYGQTKAAGDLIVGLLPKHYIIRTSWLVGEGKNFVRTMLELGQKGANPNVVSDQFGRLTFTSELVRAIDHLLNHDIAAGTYNLSNSGPIASWADIARNIFELAGFDGKIIEVSTKEYLKNKKGAAHRPLGSELDLSKIIATGFKPSDWRQALAEYVRKEQSA